MDAAPPSLDLSPGENDRAVLERVLRAFWSAVPQAAGVLLVDDEGRPLAYDLLHDDDADALAGEALRLREVARLNAGNYGPSAPGGTLVAADGGPVLVVFLPPGYEDDFPRVQVFEGVAA